jgi:hypothetical protein
MLALVLSVLTASMFDDLNCYCECAPQLDIVVCQGNLVTKVKMIHDPPGPGIYAHIQSFAKTTSDPMTTGSLTIMPCETWGDVDMCSDIKCECNE